MAFSPVKSAFAANVGVQIQPYSKSLLDYNVLSMTLCVAWNILRIAIENASILFYT